MGFLEKLWDETIAGPTPDSGLDKLRKYNTFSHSRSNATSCIGDHQIPISRCITLRSNSMRYGDASSDSGSTPSSPAASSTPSSPFSPNSMRGNNKKLKRKSTINPNSPKGYDWIVLSALER